MEEHALTVGEALIWAFGELSAAGIPFSRDESEFLLMHVLDCTRSELFLNARRPLTPKESELLREAASRRAAREPAQYIFGEAEFRGRSFKVTPDVLIPRPETELLVEEARKEAPAFGGSGLTIIDLCTGSGCIAVSIALEMDCHVLASDISEKALEVAGENARRLEADKKVTFLKGDLFAPIPEKAKGRTHMLLTNPPYINWKDMAALAPEVKDFEPREALYGGTDGLDIIKKIIEEAPGWLVPGGLLLMEIGYDQGEAVRMLAEGTGRYGYIEILKDYAGIGRILKARSKD
ncbi:Release factor glutamine methyltransferase [uncultured bacterium]|nr:Release factor glutamine methyltransferase [uncultured bacterium]